MEDLKELQEKYKLSDDESSKIYLDIYKDVISNSTPKTENCNFIVGQQGSGKSSFSRNLSLSKSGTAIIDGDFIRSFHPYIKELLEQYPNDYFYIIFPDWIEWKNKLISDLIKNKSEFNLEFACSDIDRIKSEIKRLEDANYTIEFYILAVNSIESRLRMLERFCSQLINSGVGRITDYIRHQTSYDNISTLIDIIDSNNIQKICLVDASFITYPVSSFSKQRNEILNSLRNFSNTITLESFNPRIKSIEECLLSYQGKISQELNERVKNQIMQLKKDLSINCF